MKGYKFFINPNNYSITGFDLETETQFLSQPFNSLTGKPFKNKQESVNYILKKFSGEFDSVEEYENTIEITLNVPVEVQSVEEETPVE